MNYGLLLGASALAASLALAPDALAQNVPLDRYEPAERGSEWFANESLDLKGLGKHLDGVTSLAVGVTGDYAYRPVAVREGGRVVASPVRDFLVTHVGFNLTFFERVRLGVNFPYLVYAAAGDGYTPDVEAATGLARPKKTATGDARANLDVRIVGEYGGPFTMAIGGTAFGPSGKESAYMSNGKARYGGRLMFAGEIGPFVYAARGGYIYRDEDVVRGELPFGGALGLRVVNRPERKITIGPEVQGSYIVEDKFKKSSVPVEVLFGAHADIISFGEAGSLRLGLGAGRRVDEEFGNPDFRGLASLDLLARYTGKKIEDRDKDAVADKDDACPDVKGERTNDPKTNGCPPAPPPGPKDGDGDGITDDKDACPAEAGVASDDPQKNGCPAPKDADEDGIPDGADACPDKKGDKTDDPKTNGCPDSDGDAVLDPLDACPAEAGKPDPDPAKNGCPTAFVKDGEIKITQQVKFKTGKADIEAGKDSVEVLQAVLKILNERSEIKKVRVEGHTDNVGAPARNKKLSAARAASVVKWLTKRGVDKARLSSVGFGQERPVGDNATEAGRRDNRRVEFHIEGGASGEAAPASGDAAKGDKPAADAPKRDAK